MKRSGSRSVWTFECSKLVAIFVASILMSSCALPKLQKPSLNLQPIAEEWSVAAMSQASSAKTVRSYAEIIPQDQFLLSALNDVENFNLDIAQAEARFRNSRAVRQAEEKSRFPQTRLSTNIGRDFGDMSRDFTDINASLSFDTGLFGRPKLSIRSAKLSEVSSCLSLISVKDQLRAQTFRAYVDAKEFALLAESERRNLLGLEELLRVATLRLETGIATDSEVALAELEYKSTQSVILDLDQVARAARRQFSILQGKAGIADEVMPHELPILESKNVTLPETPGALGNLRADVLASRFDMLSLAAESELVRRERLPSLSLIFSGTSSGSEAQLFDLDAYFTRIGLALNTLLFDGGASRKRYEASAHLVEAALANYEKRLRSAIADIQTTREALEASTQSHSHLSVAARRAEESLRLEELKYRNGEASLLDVLTIQRRLAQTQQAQTRALANSYRATARLLLFAGGSSKNKMGIAQCLGAHSESVILKKESLD